MKDDSFDKQARKVIPESENKCVWMESGYISFKLCDFGYDCANCGLDIAMRTHHSNRRGSAGVAPTPPTYPQELKEVNQSTSLQLLDEFQPFHQKLKPNLCYHSGFSWLEKIDEKKARIGIDPFLLQLLENVHVIVMPLPNSRIHQGEYFCWLFGDYAPLPLVSPVNGVVNFINEKVRQEPESLITQENKYIWLADVTIDDYAKDKKNLMDGYTAHQWRDAQVEILKRQLGSSLESNLTQIGNTLLDGGTRLTHIVDVLGKKQYYDIIFKFIKKVNQ
jgi:glycine cleavage system H lipoate-binding protein